MIVVNTQPFSLVYVLVEHQHLGYLIEPHVVQINSLGHYTLTHQRIFSKTSEYYKKNIQSDDLTIIKILDETDDDFIFKKFNTETKKRIRKSEFFKKQFNEELHAEQIRPFIEKKLTQALLLLKNKPLFKMGNDNNPTGTKINICEEPANVWFHFKKNDEGFRYYPTIKYQNNLLDFKYKNAKLIVIQPAWMLLDGLLLHFDKDVDGKKLLPFLNKRFIQVPKATQETYLQKFVSQLVEKYYVKSDCFYIENQKPFAKTVLSMQQFFGNDVALKLQFNYNEAVFDFGSNQAVLAVLTKRQNEYKFTRVERNIDFENKQAALLESLGLRNFNQAYFTLPSVFAEPNTESLLAAEGTNKYEFLEWLNQHHEVLANNNITVTQSNEATKYFIGLREIKLEVSEHRDWFDVKAAVQFGDYTFSFLTLKEYILKGKREFLLPNGMIAIIPEEWFGNLSGILEFNQGADEEIKLEKHHVGLLDELSYSGGKYLRISDKIQRMREYGDTVKETPLPSNFKGELRPYQQAGYNWFYFLKENQFGGCLADDMGLGKTIQTLSMLQMEHEFYVQNIREKRTPHVMEKNTEESPQALVQTAQTAIAGPNQLDLFDMAINADNRLLYEQSKGVYHHSIANDIASAQKPDNFIRPSLLIVPNSLIYNWFNEAYKFTPHLKLLNYTGSSRIKNASQFVKYDLVVTTYGTARVDIEILREFKFNYIILDESQAIKNPHSQSAKSVLQLRSNHRLVLTGTPVENNLQELWSQFAFINPGLLGSVQSFNERFILPIEKHKNTHKLTQLKSIIKPFILRRTKQQVATELPEKTEQLVYCEMTEAQQEAYEKVKSHYRNEILKSIKEIGLGKAQFTLLQGLTRLRQIANHPVLANREYEAESGKFEEVIAMAQTAMSEGHKTLIFSQFVQQLNLYKTYFDENNIQYCYLDGSMNSKQRQQQVNIFQEGNTPFFLISLKAGGFGLNLTQADYVFVLDPWWNPAVERQAVDRAHRIGQTQNVFIYKFITKNSVEEKIIQLQEKKQNLADNIISNDEALVKQINAEEMLSLLY